MPTDVFTILSRHISHCLFQTNNWFLLILHQNALFLVSQSIVPILYSSVKLLFGLDFSLTSHQMVILNKIILSLPFNFSILNNKPFSIGIFGQHSPKQLYFCKLIKCLPGGFFLHPLEISEILSPIFEGVVIFELLY